MRRIQLAALVAVPVLYYFALIVGAATYPGYSHVTRYASELGAADAPWPDLFNYSIVAGGLAALLGAVGLAGALRDHSGRTLWAILAAIALALWGAGMVMGGWFPMPDERHGGFGLGLAAPLVPLFTLLALWRVPGPARCADFSSSSSSGRWCCWRSCSASASWSPAPMSASGSGSTPASASPGWRCWGRGC
jgi:uncharacterized protein DUF998